MNHHDSPEHAAQDAALAWTDHTAHKSAHEPGVGEVELKPKLLPCPHCGKPAEMVESKSGSSGPTYRVECSDVMCIAGRISWGGKESSAHYWNQRATTPPDTIAVPLEDWRKVCETLKRVTGSIFSGFGTVQLLHIKEQCDEALALPSVRLALKGEQS